GGVQRGRVPCAVGGAPGGHQRGTGTQDAGRERLEYHDGERYDRCGQEGRGGGEIGTGKCGGKGMASVDTKLITAEEFYDWANRPENRDKYCELERGEIVEMSRPGKRHGLICANGVRILWNYAA